MENTQNKKTVLLVEDDTSIRELYAMAFIRAGLLVKMAANGAEGLKLALENHPALILLDIDMPVMNGFEVCERVRADEWGKTAQIVFLTNRSDPFEVAHAAINQPDDYIIKANVTVKEVVNKVLAAVGEKLVS